MSPFEEKPFRSREESNREPAEVFIRFSHPQVRAHVVPIAGRTGELTKHDFVTSFLVAWQPVPTPPAHWIELLRSAPFGTQAIRARDLRWDGHFFSVELVNESDIEAFSVEIQSWVDFANAEFGRGGHSPAEEALAEARKRAESLEQRLRH
jgi:hypothetical protein